ncbi:hypothetical protein IHE45_10G043800 [Dioscorea alata]|uniref:Uncharacterized protein n=1 Tax=Dioscorea alata TaxID=55571 RepID=A0ACB7VAP1_DIOAL|nr:hypothetical protein IHE45_10G043800 [Dioscorea alata]
MVEIVSTLPRSRGSEIIFTGSFLENQCAVTVRKHTEVMVGDDIVFPKFQNQCIQKGIEEKINLEIFDPFVVDHI